MLTAAFTFRFGTGGALLFSIARGASDDSYGYADAYLKIYLMETSFTMLAIGLACFVTMYFSLYKKLKTREGNIGKGS